MVFSSARKSLKKVVTNVKNNLSRRYKKKPFEPTELQKARMEVVRSARKISENDLMSEVQLDIISDKQRRAEDRYNADRLKKLQLAIDNDKDLKTTAAIQSAKTKIKNDEKSRVNRWIKSLKTRIKNTRVAGIRSKGATRRKRRRIKKRT